MDSSLLPFIRALDTDQEERCLVQLIEKQAAPIIRRILSSSLRFHLGRAGSGAANQSADDLFGDVVVNLLRRLRSLKADPSRHVINDFRGYVASATYNACYLYLRHKYPQRCRVKNRLRYLLTHHQEFALWVSVAHGLLCGFAKWRGRDSIAAKSRLEQISQKNSEWEQAARLASIGNEATALINLLTALFNWTGKPIELEDLVNIVANLWGVKDRPDEPLDTVSELSGSHITLETALEQRDLLGQLWGEICLLPPRQRAALLLNLRDAQGRDLITILPFTRTATIEEIAVALDIPLAQFAQLWNDLPLDDTKIAQLLDATRQQVINLRKCARERLERRMKALQREHIYSAK
jgi:hypothetical protein